MNDVLTLVTAEYKREVFCALRSIGQSEFYKGHAAGYEPTLKFILSDYLEYDGEMIVIYNGNMYRVLRTYRSGNTMELIVTHASAEEREIYG